MCDFIAAVNILPDSQCWVRVKCKRLFCQRDREEKQDSPNCHIWELNFSCGPEIYYSVLLMIDGGSKETWYVEGYRRLVTHNGCVVCTSSIDRGQISCISPAGIHLQVKKTGGRHKEGIKGAWVRERRRVFPTHHSCSCYCGVVERFIDYLRMHSVRVDKAAVRCDRDRGGRMKQANMNDREWGDPFPLAHWWWHTCLSSRLAL